MENQATLQEKKQQKLPAIFSFFAGSGFLDFGFERAGYEIVFVNEISPSFLKAYQYARERLGQERPRFGYHNVDINAFLNTRKAELLNHVNDLQAEERLVGFIGGPPCPDFSIAGKNKGANGENGKLSLAYINLIAQMKPDFFLFENVKGLWSTARHREYFESLKEKLNKAGYATCERLCNAIEFGVPQDRERVIMFGIKCTLLPQNALFNKTIINFPWEQFKKYNINEIKTLPWSKTTDFGQKPQCADGIIPALTVEYWFQKNDVEKHPNAKKYFTPRSGIVKMRSVQEGDVSRKSYKRLHRYRYSPTAAYGNNEVHLHPYKVRRISAAEALAIQSMPKEFELPADMSLSDMFKTIGNGVPFLLSNSIAKTINAFLEDNICRE